MFNSQFLGIRRNRPKYPRSIDAPMSKSRHTTLWLILLFVAAAVLFEPLDRAARIHANSEVKVSFPS